MRSLVHFTGRFNARAQYAATTSSPYSVVFMPKPPPTSPTSTRIIEGAIPSTSPHNSSRNPVGVVFVSTPSTCTSMVWMS